jgi:hypothetical protein
MDITQIENELRRILNSRESIVQRTKMADTLCQKVSEYHACFKTKTRRFSLEEITKHSSRQNYLQ